MTFNLQISLVHVAFSAILMLAAVYLQFSTYPKFSAVGKEHFIDFHKRSSNASFIFFIIFMFLELFSFLLIVLEDDLKYFEWVPFAIIILALWIISFLFMLKLDEKLNAGKHGKIIKEVSHWNWIRIFLWFAKTTLFAMGIVKNISK